MRKYLLEITLIAVLLITAGTVSASGTVLGANDAVLCFHESQMKFGDDPGSCTKALRNGALTRRDQAATYSNRGIIFARMDEYERALQDHNKAIELMPDMAQLYINRGNVYYRLRQYEEALREYQHATDMGSVPLYLPYFNAGLALLKLKRDAEAVTVLERALELAPESHKVQTRLAHAKEIAASKDKN